MTVTKTPRHINTDRPKDREPASRVVRHPLRSEANRIEDGFRMLSECEYGDQDRTEVERAL